MFRSMLARVAYGGVPAWQIPVSIALMVATIFAMLRVAGRVYAGAALRLGGRVKLRGRGSALNPLAETPAFEAPPEDHMPADIRTTQA